MDGKTIVRKLVGDDEERAVSPVIGVILMVAITVILAAVITAFVMDMGPGGDPVNAAVTLDHGGDGTAELTVVEADNVETIEAADGSDCFSSDEFSSPAVGQTSEDSSCNEGNDVIIIAENGDNEEIILNTEI